MTSRKSKPSLGNLIVTVLQKRTTYIDMVYSLLERSKYAQEKTYCFQVYKNAVKLFLIEKSIEDICFMLHFQCLKYF